MYFQYFWDPRKFKKRIRGYVQDPRKLKNYEFKDFQDHTYIKHISFSIFSRSQTMLGTSTRNQSSINEHL